MYLVVVLGSTGAGKSKLALQIAHRFKGEIISTDAMQVYKGLDIVTNKVSPEEMQMVRHHMIDFVSPLKYDYDVHDFRNAAVFHIDNLMAEGKLPVIVGGTNYYIESLLWNYLIGRAQEGASDSNEPIDQTEKTQSPQHKTEEIKSKYEKMSTLELHQRLKELDPPSARRLHPKDRRKITRALEVCESHGVPVSQLYAEQQSAPGGGNISGPLRYPRVCLIWVTCDQHVLDARTDKRVDKMIDRGLLAELTEFHRQYNQQRLEDEEKCDYTRGIFQSIGFKEFHEYLIMPESEREIEQGQKLLAEGIEKMKRVTRRYARYQKSFVTNRIINRSGADVPAVYAVDSTDVDKWDENVYQPAEKIVESFLEGRDPPYEPVQRKERNDEVCHEVCEICGGLVFVRKLQWEGHLKSSRHKKSVQRMHRQAKLEKLRAELQAKESESPHENTITECSSTETTS